MTVTEEDVPRSNRCNLPASEHSRVFRFHYPLGVMTSLEFSNPWAFLAMPLVAFWLVRLRRGRLAALRFPSVAGLESLPRGRVVWAERLRWSIRWLSAGLLVTALAGPRLPDEKTRIPTSGVTIVFVLDVSGSMDQKTFAWNDSEKISRKDAAKRAFRLMLEGGEGPGNIKFEGRSTELSRDAVGLVTFANWPQPLCTPTLNYVVMLKILDDSRPPSVLDTGTNIGDALLEGLKMLESAPTQRKALILLSDGEHNIDLADPNRNPAKPRQAAQIAAALKIPIHTIDTGGEPVTVVDINSRNEGRAINESIANMTGGRFFTPNDGPEFLAVCKELDNLEREQIPSFIYRRYFELYPWLIGAAFVLLSGLMIVESIWLRRMPR
jgi:Ca-activated chloride channel homolog